MRDDFPTYFNTYDSGESSSTYNPGVGVGVGHGAGGSADIFSLATPITPLVLSNGFYLNFIILHHITSSDYIT